MFGVVFWVGGLLMLSRLMSQVAGEVGAAREALIVAARRLLGRGATVAAAIALLFGIGAVIAEPQVLKQGWLHVKLLFVAVILGCHFWLHRQIRELEKSPGSAIRGAFTAVHGIVSIALLIILALVFLRPF